MAPIDDAAVAGAETEKELEEEKDCLAKALAHPVLIFQLSFS